MNNIYTLPVQDLQRMLKLRQNILKSVEIQLNTIKQMPIIAQRQLQDSTSALISEARILSEQCSAIEVVLFDYGVRQEPDSL